MMTIIADAWQVLKPGDLLTFLACVAVLLGIVVLVLTGVVLSKQVFGRTPPIDAEFAMHSATVEKIREDLSRLAPNEKVDALVEKLGSFATVTMMAEVKADSDRQAKDTRRYAHDEVHGLKNELHPRLLEIEGEARERGERLAKIEAVAGQHSTQLTEIRQQILSSERNITDRIGAILAEMPSRVISLMRDRTR